MKFYLFYVVLVFLLSSKLLAQSDTLNVMTYNVLNYGDQCQGGNSVIHNYLKSIVGFAKPDLIGLVKMASIKLSPSDINNESPYGFADSIINYALTPGTLKPLSYCTFTNKSGDNAVSVLFYNNAKLGYISTTTLSTSISDFNLYKLFYKDPNLSSTSDTTFLYVVLNHTQSGTDASTRNQQEAAILTALKKRFYHLPNLIMMGDFNVHNSSEQFYTNYTAPTDTNFIFFDPPFGIDGQLNYPADWDNNPGAFAPYLTTSTRQSATYPNTCGTSGGGKSWYDHILLPSWIKNNKNYISYITNSYTTIGNDGHRTGISIDDSTTVGIGKNTSAPSEVINALFQLSNKYPVSLKLRIDFNTTGNSPPDPDKTTTSIISPETSSQSIISIQNPVNEKMHLQIDQSVLDKYGREGHLVLTDLDGKIAWQETIELSVESAIEIPILSKGIYLLKIFDGHFQTCLKVVL